MLSVSDVNVSYGKVQALRDVSLSVGEGEVTSVIGPNGAGKSTLANAISGFKSFDGVIEYRGSSVHGRPPESIVESGLIHCTESRNLFGFMTVDDNLELGSYQRGDVAERKSLVYELFPRLDERRNQRANTMSGGEQQMLAIARALMSDPDLLILDEPTLGLAPIILEDISDGIDAIQSEGVTVLLCEQNVTFAMDHADEIHLLENGEIVRSGSPAMLRDDDYIRESYLGG
ncbi:ABC transporter ATP-binding protein [Halobacteriales archaeon QH_7_65_31]|nr:MAG: ABC transporter ATP-binding protein [Halobacteriales archaeon QH_7_65_31]